MSEIHTIRRLATPIHKSEHISYLEALEVAAKLRGHANWQHAGSTEKPDPPKPDGVFLSTSWSYILGSTFTVSTSTVMAQCLRVKKSLAQSLAALSLEIRMQAAFVRPRSGWRDFQK